MGTATCSQSSAPRTTTCSRSKRAPTLPLPLQDAGFFDTTKTGEITSRLAADTTTVSDQICLNLNVMLRSATQVGGTGRGAAEGVRWGQLPPLSSTPGLPMAA